MNQLEKFNQSVQVLVKAYLDGTLIKGFCHACAVGNLVADALGGVYKEQEGSNSKRCTVDNTEWFSVFRTVWADDDNYRFTYQQRVFEDAYEGEARRQIDATGYTWKNLARIEFAFESASNNMGEEGMFAGLMAVVDCLADIHFLDLTTATEAKALFVKA